MIEKVFLPEAKEHDNKKFDWAIKGHKEKDEPKVKVTNLDRSMPYDEYDKMTRNKFKEMHENEQRWEEFQIEDAEMILVAIGISSRVCKSAVREARAQGIRLGLIRPITVWPFPEKAFRKLPETCKALATVEMSLSAQMAQDVILASKNRLPMYSLLTSKYVATPKQVVDYSVLFSVAASVCIDFFYTFGRTKVDAIE